MTLCMSVNHCLAYRILEGTRGDCDALNLQLPFKAPTEATAKSKRT
jgi:hypothetical protein